MASDVRHTIFRQTLIMLLALHRGMPRQKLAHELDALEAGHRLMPYPVVNRPVELADTKLSQTTIIRSDN